jgi:GNAT superfamily N-acetyltransferase
VDIVFEQCDPSLPPASELIEAVLAEFDATMGRRLRGGPSATPDELSPPAGAYVVGFAGDQPACGGGIKDLGDGVAELKRMYVVPQFRGRGVARQLLESLEALATDLGYQAIRLDSWSPSKGFYVRAGYEEIPDYNDNPHAEFWCEKRL